MLMPDETATHPANPDLTPEDDRCVRRAASAKSSGEPTRARCHAADSGAARLAPALASTGAFEAFV
jgi:hypothetical protein